MAVSFEAKLGIGQATLFVPLAGVVMLATGLLQVVVVLLAAYGDATWLHGRSFDFDALLYHSSLYAMTQGEAPTGEGMVALLLQYFPPFWVFASTWVQNLSLVGGCAVIIAIGAWLRRRHSGIALPLRAELADAFGFRPASSAMLGVGLFGGLALMWLPAALMEVVSRFVELDNASGELIAASILGSSSGVLVFGIFTIAILVPVLEEMVFRGFLWRTGERWLHPGVVLVLTSIVFAAFHMSPAHVLGVTTHAFFLGWLRLTSRSIWPGVVAHIANNGLASVLMLLVATSDEPTSLAALAIMWLVGGAGLAAATWAAWRLRVTE